MMSIIPDVRGRWRRRTARAVSVVLMISLVFSGCASTPGGGGGGGEPTPAGPAPDPQTSAQAGATTIVAIAPPGQQCCKKQTLPEFLGLTDLGKAIGGAAHRVISRVVSGLDLQGRFPALQPKPPLVPITDPSNLNEDAPPVLKAAAGAKTEEDTAPQKIMAIRYLAELGCGGCYPNIEDALLASLDDCTEAVRFEAVNSLRGSNRPSCHYCNSKRCCSNKVQKRLQAMAFDMDKERGCYVEPSARVRRAARLALQQCGGLTPEQQQQLPGMELPEEGPVEPTPASGGGVAQGGRGRSDGSDATEVRSPLLNGVRLTSLATTPKSKGSTADPEVARVNGEPVLESQVAPQLESVLVKWRQQGLYAGPDAMQAAWQSEVNRAVDVKLLVQQCRQELISQGKLAPSEKLSQERFLAWYEEALPVEEEISMLELTQYYQENQGRFQTPARVRWERISAFVGGFRSREEAFAVMQSFRARAQGFPVAEVPFSRQVVQIDTMEWTTRGDVESKVVGDTLFSLPVGKLSPILDEGDKLHLVRVLERQTAGTKPFEEVSDGLRAELLQRRVSEAERQYVARLRQVSQVATVFDSGPGQPARIARLPAQVSGEPTPAAPRDGAAVPNGSNSNQPTPALRPSAPAGGGAGPAAGDSARIPAPSTPQVRSNPIERAGGASSGGGGVRPATMLDLGENVRHGLYLERTDGPQPPRTPLSGGAIPSRRPSQAVTGAPGAPAAPAFGPTTIRPASSDAGAGAPSAWAPTTRSAGSPGSN